MEQGFWTVMFGFSLVILIMANGLAIMIGGPAAAGRFNRWVGRTLWRTVSRTIGWALRALADLFDGRGQRRNRNRDDDRH